MKSSFPFVPFLTWAAALYVALNLGIVLKGRLSAHLVCGPWGCGPEPEALIAWHGFCLALIVPPAAYLAHRRPSRWLRWTGMALTASGALGLVGISCWVSASWLPLIQEGEPTYLVQRYLFVLFAEKPLVSIPIFPLTIAGIVLLCMPAWKRVKQDVKGRAAEKAEQELAQ